MGNWRTVNMTGTMTERDAAALREHLGYSENCHYHEELKGNGWCATVRQLGTEFAGHPAYLESWKPE